MSAARLRRLGERKILHYDPLLTGVIMIKSNIGAALLVSFLAFASAGSARAQMSIDDIEAAVENGTDELSRVDALLADPDQNRRIAGIQLLLASGNPLYVKRAREAGLLSSDPDMQLAALKATLDAGGGIQMVFDLANLPADALKAWQAVIADYGSMSIDGKTGTVTYDLRGSTKKKTVLSPTRDIASCD